MIRREQIRGRAFSAIEFDGTFESAVEITELVKEQLGFSKDGRAGVKSFGISRFQDETRLSFNVVYPEQGQLVTVTVSMRAGDWLIRTKRYHVLSKDMFLTFFERVPFDILEGAA